MKVGQLGEHFFNQLDHQLLCPLLTFAHSGITSQSASRMQRSGTLPVGLQPHLDDLGRSKHTSPVTPHKPTARVVPCFPLESAYSAALQQLAQATCCTGV